MENTIDLKDLYQLARQYDDSWEAAEAVDWNEAEVLVERIRALGPDVLAKHPDLQGVIRHADENEDWDAGEVGQWPQLVIESLAGEV